MLSLHINTDTCSRVYVKSNTQEARLFTRTANIGYKFVEITFSYTLYVSTRKKKSAEHKVIFGNLLFCFIRMKIISSVEDEITLDLRFMEISFWS
jgi:hypothetical protein